MIENRYMVVAEFGAERGLRPYLRPEVYTGESQGEPGAGYRQPLWLPQGEERREDGPATRQDGKRSSGHDRD